jgi:hypothetical protein
MPLTEKVIMQTTTQDAKQTVPPSLLQSLLPYLLASVVLTALPLYVIAEDNPSGVTPAISCPYTNPTQNGVTPSMQRVHRLGNDDVKNGQLCQSV